MTSRDGRNAVTVLLVPTYAFRCSDGCDDFAQLHPIAAPPDGVDCPTCGASARRLIGRPAISTTDRAAMAVHDATRASADSPPVVRHLPGRRRRPGTPVTTDPRHRRLPRP